MADIYFIQTLDSDWFRTQLGTASFPPPPSSGGQGIVGVKFGLDVVGVLVAVRVDLP